MILIAVALLEPVSSCWPATTYYSLLKTILFSHLVPFFYILKSLSTRLPERPNMYPHLLHKIKKLPLGSFINWYDKLKAV